MISLQLAVIAYLFAPIHALSHSGASWINLQRLPEAPSGPTVVDAATPSFPVFTFTQPLDHFSDTGFTWEQRFWVSDRHFKAGGPVIILDSGESSGTARLPYMDTGIVDILANATGGLGVVLEHRYYGQSIPVQNFTTDSMRWLNLDQALADSANFMANVKFANISQDLTAPGTPWIYYGGSYAGARSAHMKIRYPDLVFGAIASSGVTYATVVDWQYYDIIRQFAPADCVQQIETTVSDVDNLIENPSTAHTIKALFGLPNVTHNQDVVSLISGPLGAWQDKNWDPAVNSASFDNFCAFLGSPTSKTVEIAKGIHVNNATVTYAAYINRTVSSRCSTTRTQDDCFGSFNASSYQATDLSQTWRAWQFQVCTQWGFLMTAPPAGHPRIISKLLDLDYASLICKFAFPPGAHFAVPPQPDVAAVNALGGLNVAADRLAIIDGQEDPWRPNTPHSDIARKRPDTAARPFKLIPSAVHHYDENGLADHTAEPDNIRTIHAEEVAFVLEWLKDFKPPST
ncbi:peptidase S28 [Phanerochaete sordida]|uniref:Peptidase S28 n=1 Tax=Phanerochaete sordida TaxID=48140 RepID=A0A9P3GGU1_9APHY|nr:peptidase S28 [Phanerochaete sordida]